MTSLALPPRYVVHCKSDRYDVYVGRPSVWGNPYSHEDGTLARYRTRSREESIEKYERWLRAQPELVERAKRELRGKVLGCWCAPARCHGEVLARIANEGAEPEESTAFTFDARAAGADCDHCPLRNRKPVPPQHAIGGKPHLVIIGQEPGAFESRVGKPFIGPSGRVLDQTLSDVGVDRYSAHVTNAILCPSDNIDGDDGQKALVCCAPRLARELAAIDKTRPIITLGKWACFSVLGERALMRARGFIWTTPEIGPKKIAAKEREIEKLAAKAERARDQKRPVILKLATERGRKAERALALLKARAAIGGRTVVPTLHPAFLLRGGDGWLPVFQIDIDRAARCAAAPDGRVQTVDSLPFVEVKTAAALERALRSMRRYVSIDIETDTADPLRCKISCVGFSDAEPGRPDSEQHTVVAYPWSRAMAKVAARFFKKHVAITHNGYAFDGLALEREGVTFPAGQEDTLHAHHAFVSHLPRRLAQVASEYVDVIPWKHKNAGTGSGADKGSSPAWENEEQLTRYNATDVIVTSLCWHLMQPDLEPEREVYEGDIAMAVVMQDMQKNGMLIDFERRRMLMKRLAGRKGALLKEMQDLAGPSFHPNKPETIRKAIFQRFRVVPQKWTEKTGAIAVDKGVLESLRHSDTRAGRLADLALRYRYAAKSLSTFLKNLPIHADGRVHPSVSIRTETGRPSASDPNVYNLYRMVLNDEMQQRIDRGAKLDVLKARYGQEVFQLETRIREIYVAPRDHVFVYFDLKQAESHMAARASGDETFIKITQEKDVHTANAKILFPDARPILEVDPKGAGARFRDMAKTSGFAVAYMAEAQTIYERMLAMGIPGVSLEACEAMISQLKKMYWRYYDFVDENMELCRRQGFIRCPSSGRKRFLGFRPELTKVANTPIQSGVAGIMRERLTEIRKCKPAPAKQVLYLYDAGVWECPRGSVADEMMALIKETWTRPVKLLSNGSTWVQPIDTKVAERWSEL